MGLKAEEVIYLKKNKAVELSVRTAHQYTWVLHCPFHAEEIQVVLHVCQITVETLLRNSIQRVYNLENMYEVEVHFLG